MGLTSPPWSGWLDQRFEFMQEVGAGSSSKVYRAVDHDQGMPVAIKVLLDVEAELRTDREVALLKSVTSPFVQRYIHHGHLPDGHPYLALEWLDGRDLGAFFQGNALSLAQAAAIVLGAAKGLAALHHCDILHRDIKPSNIFICDPEGDAVPKLIDLGVARVGSHRRDLHESGLVGTPSYMSPEMASMEPVPISYSSDVYSLCAVYYELLTGRRPHEHNHLPMLLVNILNQPIVKPSVHNREVPAALDSLILKGLARRAEERFPHGEALVEALERLISSDFHGATNEAAEVVGVAELPCTPEEPRAVALLLIKSDPSESGCPPETIAQIRDIATGFSGQLYHLDTHQLLAVFGHDITLGDEVNRALKTGLRIQRDFYMATSVVLGKFGGEFDLKPSLDLAIRLLEQPGLTQGVRVDGNAARRARAEFVVLRRKGFSIVPGIKEWQDRSEVQLIGREREQSQLLSLLQASARDSKPQIALVVGEDGMGKSSLATWFYGKVNEEGFRLVAVAGQSESRDTPYGLIERLIALRASISDQHTPAVRQKLIERFCARHISHSQVLSALLGGMKNWDMPEEPGLRWGLWEAISDVVETDLASGPLIWLVDDYCLVDKISQDLIGWLLSSARGALVLVALTPPAQLEALRQRLPPDVTQTIIQLTPLTRDQSGSLVRNLLSDADPEEVAAIVNRAGGNPLFVEELARLSRQTFGERALTRNIQITVQMALDRLSRESIQMARAASVLGERGNLAVLQHLLPEVELLPSRRELEQSGIFLAYPPGHERERNGWRFKHALTRDAVYHMLPHAARIKLHKEAAHYYDRPEERDPRKAARHFVAAKLKEEAARCLLELAHVAHNAADSETTLHLVQKVRKLGLAGVYKQEMLYLRASANTWLGRLVPGLDDVRALLLEDGLDPAMRARAACLGCMQARRLGSAVDGFNLARTAIESAQRAGDQALLARCYFHAAFLHYDRGEVKAMKRCLDAFAELDLDNDWIACIHGELEHLYAVLCQDFEWAMEKGKQVMRANRQLGNYQRLGANLANIGLCLRHLGRIDEALSYLAMSSSIYRRQHNRLQRYDAVKNEARLLGMLGRFEEANQRLDEAADGFAKSGEVHQSMELDVLRARFLLARSASGDLEAAGAILHSAAETSAPTPLFLIELHIANMEAYLRGLPSEVGIAAALASLHLLESRGSGHEHATEALCLAACVLEQAGHARAVEALERATASLEHLLSRCNDPASWHGLRERIWGHSYFLQRHPL